MLRLGDIRKHAAAVKASLSNEYALYSLHTLKTLNSKISGFEGLIDGDYFITTEKGLFRMGSNGLYHILNFPTYGIAISGECFFLSIQIGNNTALIISGQTQSLFQAERLQPIVVKKFTTLTSNHRIHQITKGPGGIWVANTQSNSILQIDPSSKTLLKEIYPFVDQFGAEITHDQNHINSVLEHEDGLFFTAYSAGLGSLIGLIHHDWVYGYGYPNPGVHDIYILKDDFLFFDTFGSNSLTSGGVPITKKGPLLKKFFSKSPGYIVRGAARCGAETLIGNSFKGRRAKRMAGVGSLLVYKDQEIRDEIIVPFAQVYQIVNIDGTHFKEPDSTMSSVISIKTMLQECLVDPIYTRRLNSYH
ncbi:MAG: hypothetical protein VW771_11545 [Gammaproteobacteria bacterium]